MYPFIQIGNSYIQTFSLFLFFGTLFSVSVGLRLFLKQKLPTVAVFYIATIAIVFGTIGSRLFYVLEFHHHFQWQIFDFFDKEGYSPIGIPVGILASLCCRNKWERWSYAIIATVLSFVFSFFAIFTIIIAIWTLFREVNQLKLKNYLWLCMAIPTILFCRIAHLYLYFDAYNWEIFHLQGGGMTVYGGLICAFVCVVIYLKYCNIPIKKSCDIIIICVFLALAFGRIGCFFNGCCFGKTCAADSPWGTQFPAASPVGQHQIRGFNIYYLWNIYAPKAQTYPSFLQQFSHQISPKVAALFFPKVYATQIVSAFYNFTLFILLYFFIRFKRYDGQIFLIGICAYSLCRFGIETYRADNPVWTLTGLTAAQSISVILFYIHFSVLLYCKGIKK